MRLPFTREEPFEGRVYRPDEVTVEALNLKGEPGVHRFQGWAARIFQHEYDHLDGILWIGGPLPSIPSKEGASGNALGFRAVGHCNQAPSPMICDDLR